ncbi:MAG: MBOAT family O-acyltransferase [Cyanobacteria bacterium P01_A01_bin.116]
MAASYLFYAAWNPPFVILLWLSTISDWVLSKLIFSSKGTYRKNLFVCCSLFINLGLLAFFKYGQFLMSNTISILNVIGISYQPAHFSVILPLGISFYTFQTLSYTLDIYFEKSKPWHSFLDYALYVTFFPQLVAGPIVRSDDFLKQCQQKKNFIANNIGWGLTLITLGIFEKVVVADVLLAPAAEALFSSNDKPNFLSAWLGTFAFSGQIFCDFSGYSTCAIGAALCLGFTLPQNFFFPYASIGFSDFWRRWHISLSTWLRDYLYIPLGGSRKGNLRTLVNLMLTMLIGGLWHGAAWTFVFWGGLHGIYLIGERVLKKAVGHFYCWRMKPIQFLLAILTFLLTSISWVFFRATSFNQAWMILGGMFFPSVDPDNFHLSSVRLATTGVIIGAMIAIHWIFREESLEKIVSRLPLWLLSIGLASSMYFIATIHGENRAFIYFQF